MTSTLESAVYPKSYQIEMDELNNGIQKLHNTMEAINIMMLTAE